MLNLQHWPTSGEIGQRETELQDDGHEGTAAFRGDVHAAARARAVQGPSTGKLRELCCPRSGVPGLSWYSDTDAPQIAPDGIMLHFGGWVLDKCLHELLRGFAVGVQ